MMGAQVILTVEDSVNIDATDMVVKHFVFGKTWEWTNEEPYIFMENGGQLEDRLGSATRIYEKPAKDQRSHGPQRSNDAAVDAVDEIIL